MLSQTNTGHHNSPDIRGSFSKVILPDVIQRIYTRRLTGELQVSHESTRRRIYFETGRAIFAASNHKGDRLGEFLVRRGDITQPVFDLVRGMIPHGRRFGQMLVEMGALTQEQLDRAVRDQILMQIYSVFEWTSGVFEFIPRNSASVPEDLRLDLSMADIILEGVGRIRDLGVVRRGMGDLNRLIAPSPDPLLRLQQATLKPHEQDLLRELTEPLDLLTILSFNFHPAAETIRSLYGLISAGFLTWVSAAEQPQAPLVEMADYEEEIDIPQQLSATRPLSMQVLPGQNLHDMTPSASVAPEQPPATEAAPVAQDSAPPDATPRTRPAAETAAPPVDLSAGPRAGAPARQPEAPMVPVMSGSGSNLSHHAREQEIWVRIREIRILLGKGDPYVLFGVARNAPREEILDQYHHLLQEFHPDKFRHNSRDLRDAVERIFQDISIFWQQVCDEKLQTEIPVPTQTIRMTGFEDNSYYLSGQKADLGMGEIAGKSPEELKRMAETNYRDAVSKLMSQQFNVAADMLKKAVNLNQADPRYHCLLGLALMGQSQKANPQIFRDAEHHYREAVRLDPLVPDYPALLGMLYTRLGMPRRAESVYRQALKLDPKNEIALTGLASKNMNFELLVHVLSRM
ncbi:MAG: DUF4388 domain-containing protein [Blastocatellia bacterium]